MWVDPDPVAPPVGNLDHGPHIRHSTWLDASVDPACVEVSSSGRRGGGSVYWVLRRLQGDRELQREPRRREDLHFAADQARALPDAEQTEAEPGRRSSTGTVVRNREA